MAEDTTWVNTSEFQEEDHWSADIPADTTSLFDAKPTTSSEKWSTNKVAIESLRSGDRGFFSIVILLSCVCYIIAITRYFVGSESSTALFSYWFTLGTGFGLLSISQFEGVGLFLARLMKKASFMLFICMIVSMIGCCLGGYINNTKLSVMSSIFQCLCLILISSLYLPSVFFFASMVTPKAKE